MESDLDLVPLTAFAKVQSGFAFKSSDMGESGSPIIKIRNINPPDVDISDVQRVPTAIIDGNSRIEKFLLSTGDILIAMTGATVGKIGRMPEVSEKYYLNQRVGKVFLINRKIADYDYVYYVLSQSGHVEQMFGLADGSAQANISGAQIESLEIPLPLLPEQKAIAHVLGSLDDKIELNRRMNATLEGMAQALFKSWFVDFDPVIDNILARNLAREPSPNLSQGERNSAIYNGIPEELAARADVRRKALAEGAANRQSAKIFPNKFQLSEELGWIPEGWEVQPASEAIDINPSVKLAKGAIAQYADMKALPTSGYTITGVIEKAYSGGVKFQNGDILFARITPCLENGKTGIVDFLPSPDAVGFGSTEFVVLRGREFLRMPFVACLARDEGFRTHCAQSMVGSSGRQRVQNACFDNYYLAIPVSNELMKQFDSATEVWFSKVSNSAKESQSLVKLRDTLLPKLISGELRIPDAEKLAEEVMG